MKIGNIAEFGSPEVGRLISLNPRKNSQLKKLEQKNLTKIVFSKTLLSKLKG